MSDTERDRGTGHDGPAGRGPRAFETLALCPACGAELIGIKCKTVCSRCRLLVENCSGD